MRSPSKNVAHYGLAWLALILATLAGVAWWWNIGRPVSMPDAPSNRIACVSYGPFRKPGDNPLQISFKLTPERIDEDLRALSQRFDCVRIYSQSNGLDVVPAIAAKYHMQVLLGIWLGPVRKINEQEVARGIANANANPKTVRAIIVGNEVLLRSDLSPQELGDYIKRVREAVPKSIPITYADVWNFWERYPQMAPLVDFITVHMLPYWEDDPVPARVAVQHVENVYAALKKEFPGKKIMIGETGWPSAGRLRRSAEPSVVDEAYFVRSFLAYAATVDMSYNMFEAFDESWKQKLEGTVGGYWGIFDSDAKPKFPMTGPVVEDPHWYGGLIAGVVFALAFMLVGGMGRGWHGARGWIALALAGFASGTAVAWQARQLYFACSLWWEWALSIACLLGAIALAAVLARRIAAHLADHHDHSEPSQWWRYVALVALVQYDVLMVFNGRYMDFPMGTFLLPCVAYGVFGLLTHERRMPSVQQRFLSIIGPLAATSPVIVELGLNKVSWLWLALNFAIAVPIWVAWRWHARYGDENY